MKTLDNSENSLNIEPGLEVKLMVKPRSGRVSSEDGVEYRATLCIPNPDKKFYDLVETTNWVEKTRKHMSDIDTLQDLGWFIYTC